MNEDQIYDAAEREMDLYRGEVARVTKERDEAREQLAAMKLVLQETSRESSLRGAEADRLSERLGRIEDAIGNLAAGLKLSASATRPSKKSDIEDGCAAALLGILDPR